MEFEIRPLYDSYRDWARQLIVEGWGSPYVVARGRLYEPAILPGYIALQGELPVGLATYNLDKRSCELITLNSHVSGIGIGAALVSAVRETAVEAGCRRLWLITTNDNLKALGFYQRVGFRLAALHKNAIDVSRELKPQIPVIGQRGIPIRDEIELEMFLSQRDEPRIVRLDHIKITIPVGAEESGRAFYCDILNLQEMEKPESLRGRGGFWLQVGDLPVHISTENDVNREATKMHLAYQATDLASWRTRLEEMGMVIKESVPIPGFDCFEIRDPFGNRIEIIQEYEYY